MSWTPTETVNAPQTAAPSEAEVMLARESGRKLAATLPSATGIHLHLDAPTNGEPLAIPPAAAKLLLQILTEMGRGHPVTVLPDAAELTISQAADVLLVSPPFLAKLLDQGHIPFTGTGADRRVTLRDALTWKRRTDADRLKTLDELSALDQQLGLGY